MFLFFVFRDSVSGGELFERVIDEEFDLTEKECTFFLRQICDGVRFMHSKAILHLDMKVWPAFETSKHFIQ